MMSKFEWFVWVGWPLAVIAICIAILVLLAVPSHGGVIECSASPGDTIGRRWLWREIDGRRCWFPAQQGQHRGRDQPKSDLRWKTELPPPPPPPTPTPEEQMPPPWEMEHRWPTKGWEHKE